MSCGHCQGTMPVHGSAYEAQAAHAERAAGYPRNASADFNQFMEYARKARHADDHADPSSPVERDLAQLGAAVNDLAGSIDVLTERLSLVLVPPSLVAGDGGEDKATVSRSPLSDTLLGQVERLRMQVRRLSYLTGRLDV